jgi:hypothetical protein
MAPCNQAKSNRWMKFWMLAGTTLLALPAFAQDNDTSSPVQMSQGPAVDASRKSSDAPRYPEPDRKPETATAGYETKQTAELGGRISNFTGNRGVWDTFVNLGTGPRLLEYTLDMHSPAHNGLLFDDLSLSSYGYGGDPNDVSRLRILKGSLYNFSANFRRDQNIFDYDLLANPLNPANSNPNIPVLDSPHEFLLTRRMSDVGLSLFSLSPVRLKLGWSRVVNEGNTFSTIHEGTESLLFQPTLNTSDTFHGGISLRLLPRTSINYDQFYTFFKGDTSATLNGTGFQLAGGIPVDLGLPFNTPAAQPCAAPLLPGGVVNPTCNGAFGYSRTGRNRNTYPTEQLSFQSNYFRRLDLSGRFNYTDAKADLPDFSETFNGLIARSRARDITQTGSATAKRISRNLDFGLTYHVSSKLRIVDNFRLDNFSIPTGWQYVTNTLVGATLLSTPNAFDPATCPPPFTAATCPQHSASSGPDVNQYLLHQFIRQDMKINTFQVEYDFTRRITAYLGYRFENREITHNDSSVQVQTFFPSLPNRGACAGEPLVNGICTVTLEDSGNDFIPINGHSAIFGFSARPSEKFRVSFDTELFYADNIFTRISPRHLQVYRVRTNYKPQSWMSFGGTVSIRENRNNTADIGNLQHNRSYAFSAVIAPAEAKWGLDFSYDYNDIFSQTNICFVATPAPPNSLSCGTPFLQGLSVYNERAHYGAGSIFLKPVARVTAALGYTVTSSTGDTLILNPNAPTGPLSFNYHLPSAMLVIQISKKLAYKTGWNFYDYNEKSAPGPTLPRDFRGNVFTVSLRYAI